MCAPQIRSAKNPEDVEKMLAFLPEEFVWYWVPALLFAVKNILSYTVVQQLGAGIARVAAQLKIIFTGVLYDGLARTEMGGTQLRRLSETEWVGLFVLFLAEILAAGTTLDPHKECTEYLDRCKPTNAVLFECHSRVLLSIELYAKLRWL